MEAKRSAMPNRSDGEGVALKGGNMNTPVLKGDRVHRKTTPASPTIHRLLRHVRAKGIHWVPEPLFLDQDTEVLSFIEGEVPHEMPPWIWDAAILCEVAVRMREWHDATADFDRRHACWNLATGETPEVICHNDFAPYNCVFRDFQFAGLIDYDLCAPGSRLWDLAYTAYRFIPLMPSSPIGDEPEHSPFTEEEMEQRLTTFLSSYACKNSCFDYTRDRLLEKTALRLLAIADWTARHADTTGNEALRANARMYQAHACWIRGLTANIDGIVSNLH
jgi:hypothetical protein